MRMTGFFIPALLLLIGPAIAQDRVLRDSQVARACADDVWKFCSDVVPGEGRVKACMKQNMGRLSAGCIDALLTAIAAARETPEIKPIPIPQQP